MELHAAKNLHSSYSTIGIESHLSVCVVKWSVIWCTVCVVKQIVIGCRVISLWNRASTPSQARVMSPLRGHHRVSGLCVPVLMSGVNMWWCVIVVMLLWWCCVFLPVWTCCCDLVFLCERCCADVWKGRPPLFTCSHSLPEELLLDCTNMFLKTLHRDIVLWSVVICFKCVGIVGPPSLSCNGSTRGLIG